MSERRNLLSEGSSDPDDCQFDFDSELVPLNREDDDEDGTETHEKKPNRPCAGACSIFGYPKGVYFILGMEFCERFSYFAMGSILVVYLLQVHKMADFQAKLVYHSFAAVGSFVPIFGSMLADGRFGRYNVIMFGSVVYVIGHAFLSSGALPLVQANEVASKMVDMIGLFVIAIGCGIMKPCVSPFAADQFPKNREHERQLFFSFYYLMVNVGAVASSLVSPVIRYEVHCFGQPHCFPLAFGVPAILMVLALLIFIAGRWFYVHTPVHDNVIWHFFCCISRAVKNKIRGKRKASGDHWLYYAGDRHNKALIEDIRGVLNIAVLFLPVTVFWALYTQTGSSWIIQASSMNGRIGHLTVLPEQVGIVNPIMIILFIPLFESYVNPFLRRIRLIDTPLKQMNVGGICVVISFVAAGFLQLAVAKTDLSPPAAGHTRVFLANMVSTGPSSGLTGLTGSGRSENNRFEPVVRVSTASQSHEIYANRPFVQLDFNGSLLYYPEIGDKCKLTTTSNNCTPTPIHSLDTTNSSNAHLVGFSRSCQNCSTVTVISQSFPLAKPDSGNSTVVVLFDNRLLETRPHLSIIIANDKERYVLSPAQPVIGIRSHLVSSPQYRVRLVYEDNAVAAVNGQNGSSTKASDEDSLSTSSVAYLLSIVPSMGGVYGLVVMANPESPSGVSAEVSTLIEPNSVSIGYQLVPFFIITVGEMFFSITGFAFSYTEAPATMRSVVMALWILTGSVGNIIDFIISGSHVIKDPANEFFFYAGLLMATVAAFILLSMRYEYKSPEYANKKKQPPVLKACR